jgi:hypothetical protein
MIVRRCFAPFGTALGVLTRSAIEFANGSRLRTHLAQLNGCRVAVLGVFGGPQLPLQPLDA